MIGVVIHTYNEERNIAECIDSARLLTDKIIVVDMYSKDRTVEIARQKGVKVKLFPFSRYVEPAREFGIRSMDSEWVFILDANLFLGKVFLRHGGWWPDYQIRLIKKSNFIKWPKEIHSTPRIKGKMGFLKNPILHLFHRDFNQMVEKTIIFEDIEADLLFRHKKPVRILTFFRKFLGELYRRLIKNKGFLDGPFGVIEALYQAYSKTITYLFLYEKYEKQR